MKDVKYDLDFYEALKIVMNGGAVKGERFVDGVFMKLSDEARNNLVLVDAGRFYIEEDLVPYKGMDSQKFREVNVFTMNELSK